MTLYRRLTVWILTLFVLLFTQQSIHAASVESYLIKQEDKVYLYDSEELEGSFLNAQLGSGDTTLYDDFKKKLAMNGFHAFQNTSLEYIDYDAIQEAFLNDVERFHLGEYLSSEDAIKLSEEPNRLLKATLRNDKVMYIDVIIDDGPDVVDID